MKLQSIYLLLVPALLSVSSCSDPEHSGFEQVPIELSASRKGEVETKAITQAFATTLFASKRAGIYTGIPTGGDEWQQNTTVQTDGSVSLPNAPFYPDNGDWIYLTAVAPQPASYDSGNGTVSYTLTGGTDLMHAQQIKGNRWDGSRFSNTDPAKDIPLEYVHLLTQLKFKARKAATGGLKVKVQKISVAAQNAVSVDLASGLPTFSGDPTALALTLADEGTEIAATTATDLGALLLPPLPSGVYKLTVETSIGTFADLAITFEPAGGGGSPGSNQFAAGHSYEITLNIGDTELAITSVTVAPWTTVNQGGELDLIE